MECFETGKTMKSFPTNSISAEGKLFYTTCVTILLYGCESWVIFPDTESKINAFATSCYRIMLGIKRQDCKSNIAIYSMTNTEPLVNYVRKHQFPWTHPSSSRGRTCKKICFLCTTSWQKEAGSSRYLLHHVHPTDVRIS